MLAGILSGVASVSAAAPPADFSRDVRPIFSDKCFACHGPDEAARTSVLRLDQEESVFAKLPSGAYTVVRGKPEESELIRRVRSENPAERMPPQYMGHIGLSGDEIETLESWVRQGARWQGHWAFLAPKRPAEPEAGNREWVRNPIDSFVLGRLQEEGLQPAEEADRATLIRRVTLDLTGLPPSLSGIGAFLNDASPSAYEAVVDRLLASPRYGERMA